MADALGLQCSHHGHGSVAVRIGLDSRHHHHIAGVSTQHPNVVAKRIQVYLSADRREVRRGRMKGGCGHRPQSPLFLTFKQADGGRQIEGISHHPPMRASQPIKSPKR